MIFWGWLLLIRLSPLPGFQSPPGLWTIFSRESQPKPSFATITGRGDNPNCWGVLLNCESLLKILLDSNCLEISVFWDLNVGMENNWGVFFCKIGMFSLGSWRFTIYIYFHTYIYISFIYIIYIYVYHIYTYIPGGHPINLTRSWASKLYDHLPNSMVINAREVHKDVFFFLRVTL